jgi:hypothetical protein
VVLDRGFEFLALLAQSFLIPLERAAEMGFALLPRFSAEVGCHPRRSEIPSRGVASNARLIEARPRRATGSSSMISTLTRSPTFRISAGSRTQV